jgi:hypothetical protein
MNVFLTNHPPKSLQIGSYPESERFEIQDRSPVVQTIRAIQE